MESSSGQLWLVDMVIYLFQLRFWMTHKRQKQRSNVQGTESPANYQEVISWKYIILLLQDVFDSKFTAELIIFLKNFYSQQGENESKKNFTSETPWIPG